MGSKSSSKAPGLPKPEELKPLLELQNQYNRVGIENPFGSQNYRRNADGTTTLVTGIGADGQAMIRRAGQLGMTDSARMQSNPQLDAIAGALAGRVGSRLGLQGGGGPMSLVSSPQSPAKPSAPAGTNQPPPNLPPVDTGEPPPTGRPMNPRRFPRDGSGY